MSRDPFEFDDYFVQDYIGTVDKVEFVVSAFDNLQAVFTNRYDEPITGNDGQLRVDRPEFYSIGSAELWMPKNGGTEFEHASGDKDKRIKSNTGYGLLLMRAIQLVGKDALLEKANPGASNGGLYASSLWTGLRFHWVTEGAGKTWTNRKTGESGTSKGHQLPVEYLPKDGSASVLSGLSAVYDVDSLGLDEDMVAGLRSNARTMSLGEFQSKGISLLRLLTDDEVKSKVTSALSDTTFYETLRLA